MSWRPEGYKNPHREHLLDLDFLGNPSIANKLRFEEFEAGADAMLEALKKDGLKVDISAGVRVYVGGVANLLYRTEGTPTGKGKLVFIPDDKE